MDAPDINNKNNRVGGEAKINVRTLLENFEEVAHRRKT